MYRSLCSLAACTAAAAVWTALASPAAAQGRPSDTSTQGVTPLENARQMFVRPAVPAFSPMAPAAPEGVVKPPNEDPGYTQAYRSREGCVAFFYPMGTDNITQVGMRWNGRPALCDGKPLNGLGELVILTQEGNERVLRTMRGQFQHGLLTGKGAKANFIFRADEPEPYSYYLFEGVFANSLLHGEGVMLYSGRPEERPRAYAHKGHFREGRPVEGSVSSHRGANLVRLQPHDDVAADIYLSMRVQRDGSFNGVQFNPDNLGSMTSPQGVLYMEGSPEPWSVEFTRWEDGHFTHGTLRQKKTTLQCSQWKKKGKHLSCERGEVTDARGTVTLRVPELVGYTLRKPATPQSPIYQPHNGQLSTDVDMLGLQSHTIELDCDAGVQACKGRGPLPVVGTAAYWLGPVALRQNALFRVPTERSTLFLRRPAAQPGTGPSESYDHGPGESPDMAIAECDAFGEETATTCTQGRAYFPDGSRWEGGWRLRNVAFSTPQKILRDSYQQASGAPAADLALHGAGWITFASKRRAQLAFDVEGAATELLACKDPAFTRNLRCRLDKGRVVFAAFEGDTNAPFDTLPTPLTLPVPAR